MDAPIEFLTDPTVRACMRLALAGYAFVWVWFFIGIAYMILNLGNKHPSRYGWYLVMDWVFGSPILGFLHLILPESRFLDPRGSTGVRIAYITYLLSVLTIIAFLPIAMTVALVTTS